MQEKQDIVLTSINKDKIKNTTLAKKTLGKGKIALTIDKLLIGASAMFEALREFPGFEYLKTISISNLTTKFNLWAAQKFPAPTPDFTGLSNEEIFKLGQQVSSEQVSKMADTLGIIFAATLEFTISHPTVCIVGLTAITSVLIVPFKAMTHKIQNTKVGKINVR